jgi:serine/threonine protein kinase
MSTDEPENTDDASDQLGPGEPRSFGNGRYLVQRRLGAGNFATVYQAFDERLDVPVAVKLLSDRWSWEPEVRGRFVQEARILRSLNDRHVVQIRDISETDDGRPFIVMDYATEGTLESRLTQRAHAAVAATTAARRIAHRDIKPSNILITRDDLAPGAAHAHRSADGLLRPGERLMLGDLGLAKDLRLDSGITVGVGTAGYMSPEQSELGAKIDTRTDIYAVSALMALVASDEPPDPLRRYSQGSLASGRPLPERIDGAFRSALECGLDVDPDHRPQTIEAWQAAVDAGLAARGDAPFAPPSPTSPSPMSLPQPTSAPPVSVELDPSTPGRRPARNLLVVSAVGALVVLGAAGVWAVAGRDGDGGAGAATTEPTVESTTTDLSTTTSPATTTPATTVVPTTTVAPVVLTAAPTTTALVPFVFITGAASIPADTPGRWWEVSSAGVVRGTWELFDSAGPVPLNGDEWIPGDGFQASLPAESYVLRLTGFDLAGTPYVTELSFTAA